MNDTINTNGAFTPAPTREEHKILIDAILITRHGAGTQVAL